MTLDKREKALEDTIHLSDSTERNEWTSDIAVLKYDLAKVDGKPVVEVQSARTRKPVPLVDLKGVERSEDKTKYILPYTGDIREAKVKVNESLYQRLYGKKLKTS